MLPKNFCSTAWKEPISKLWSPSVTEKPEAGALSNILPFSVYFHATLGYNQDVSISRFILPGDMDLDDTPYEDFLSTEEVIKQRKEGEDKRRQELLKKVEFSK